MADIMFIAGLIVGTFIVIGIETLMKIKKNDKFKMNGLMKDE